MAESRVLVVGANGQLGSVIVRKMAAAAVPVRAVGRNAQKLETLRAPGVEIVPVDLMNSCPLNDVTTLVEKQLGRGSRRRHIPVSAMTLLPPVVHMFDELAARMMMLGYFATIERPFPGWKKAADRFGAPANTRGVRQRFERLTSDQVSDVDPGRPCSTIG